MDSTKNNNSFPSLFKNILDSITTQSNIDQPNIEGQSDLFNIDSGHDFLFEKTLAAVTTESYTNIPPGCSGEDRFVWNGMQNKLFENVKFFGVYEHQNEGVHIYRQFFWLNNGEYKTSANINITPHNFSYETGRFLFEDMFEIEQAKITPDGKNHSFLFQTVHDAGKMLINTHLSTVSNHIDSAGTPKNDKRNKQWKNELPPLNYNTPNEGMIYNTPGTNPAILNQIYLNGTVFSDNGSKDDGDWALNDEQTIVNNQELFRPWFDTKYSLLIFKYIVKPFMKVNSPGELIRIQNSGIKNNHEINLAVINFIWQITLYFCLKSFVAPDNNDKEAIAYLRNVVFVDFKNKRHSYYQLNSNNPYITITKSLFDDDDVTMVVEPTTPIQKWVVTQALCAEIILAIPYDPQNEFTTYSVSQRNADGEQKVDTNTQYLFSRISQYKPKVILRAMQLLKFSGDTSHTVQTLLQFMSLSKLNTDNELPKRISMLTTLERILSVRMLKFIANTNIHEDIGNNTEIASYGFPLNTNPTISVMFNTGTYLQDNHPRHKNLIKQINVNVHKEIKPKIKYFGVYVMQNAIKQKEDKIKSITKLRLTITNDTYHVHPDALGIIRLFLYDQGDVKLADIDIADLNNYYNQLSKLFEIAKGIPTDGKKQNITTLFRKLSKLLNESLNLVLYGFMRKNLPGTKNIPNLDTFYSKGIEGELSNLTLNMDHGDPNRDLLSNYKLEDLLKINIEKLKEIINSIFEFIDIKTKTNTEEQTSETQLYNLLLTSKFVNTDVNIADLWCQSFNGDFQFIQTTDPPLNGQLNIIWKIQETLLEAEAEFPLFNSPEGIRTKKIKPFTTQIIEERIIRKLRNLLITTDKFSKFTNDNMPTVAYSNSENSSSIAKLVKYIKKTVPDLDGWAFLETTLTKVSNIHSTQPVPKNDFVGIIHLIRFFVNSGRYTSRPFTKNKFKIYNDFKEQSERLILLLEQLNTIAPICVTPLTVTPASTIPYPPQAIVQTGGRGRKIKKTKKKGGMRLRSGKRLTQFKYGDRKDKNSLREKRRNTTTTLRRSARTRSSMAKRNLNNNNFESEWMNDIKNADISSTLIEIIKIIFSYTKHNINYIEYQLTQLIPYALTIRYVENDIVNKEIYFLLYSIYNIINQKVSINPHQQSLLLSTLNSLKAQAQINIDTSQQTTPDDSFINLNIFETVNGYISLTPGQIVKDSLKNRELINDIIESTKIDKGPTKVYFRIGDGWKEKRTGVTGVTTESIPNFPRRSSRIDKRRKSVYATNYVNPVSTRAKEFVERPSYYWFAYKYIKDTYLDHLTESNISESNEDVTLGFEAKIEQVKIIFDSLFLGNDILDIDKDDTKEIPNKLMLRFIHNHLNFIFKTHLFNCIEQFLNSNTPPPLPVKSSINLEYFNLTIDLLYLLYKNRVGMTPVELLPETTDIYSRYIGKVSKLEFETIINQFEKQPGILSLLHNELLNLFPPNQVGFGRKKANKISKKKIKNKKLSNSTRKKRKLPKNKRKTKKRKKEIKN